MTLIIGHRFVLNNSIFHEVRAGFAHQDRTKPKDICKQIRENTTTLYYSTPDPVTGLVQPETIYTCMLTGQESTKRFLTQPF